MDLGWQFNVEYWYFFLVFQVFAQTQGSLEDGAFIIVGGGLHSIQLFARFFIEFFLLSFVLVLRHIVIRIIVFTLGITFLGFIKEVSGRLTAVCKSLFLKHAQVFNELSFLARRLGVIIELLSSLLMESSVVQVATILLYSRLAFSHALDAGEFLE